MVKDRFTSPLPDNSPSPAEALLEEEDDLECFAEQKDSQCQL